MIHAILWSGILAIVFVHVLYYEVIKPELQRQHSDEWMDDKWEAWWSTVVIIVLLGCVMCVGFSSIGTWIVSP